MAIFDDGTPLDAAILQDLDRRLTEVKSSIPQIGTTVINNSTVQQVVKSKQIFGGEIPSKTIKYGSTNSIPVTFAADAVSTPTAISVTPIFSGSLANSVSCTVRNLTTKGFTLDVFMPTKTGTTQASMGFYYVVICS